MPYSRNDTPEVARRIRHDLDIVRDTVRKNDPACRSLVLTGGFARGEGTVLHGEPQNDYDFVAIRALGRPRVPYATLRGRLEDRLGLHIDLAPVPQWRLRFSARSIFWYETALRGRTIWGEEMLHRIPVRHPKDLDPGEALRLLVNRAAGLLLCTQEQDAHKVRIQAAKALLAASDAHLLATGLFPPTQVERWRALRDLRTIGRAPRAVEKRWAWHDWAFTFKTDPARAETKEARLAWRTAATAVLDAVAPALRMTGHPTLTAYGQGDGLVDHFVYYRRSAAIESARRFLLHPTGRVRLATLRLLASSMDGTIPADAARDCLSPFTGSVPHPPVPLLDALRKATLQ